MIPLFLLCVLLVGVQGLSDPQRPVYHMMPPSNWMNDPNGPMYFNGIYHLFYQYNPNAAVWGDMHWGHAVSKDLVYWQNLPPALYPDEPYDEGGIYSGSATIVGNIPFLTYTGMGLIPSQCIATPSDLSDPFLVNWTKSPENPVIPQAPPSLPLDGYRDPTTAWQVGDLYYMLVGAGISNSEGMALLYSTPNFLEWNYSHPLYQSFDVNVSGTMWECPDFYDLEGQYVLKASTDNGDMWFIGDYFQGNQTFEPITQGLFDYGQFYASKTFNDTLHNRRVLWGWVAEMDSQNSSVTRGWAGLQCIPRELTLTPDNRVAANPIVELEKLRTEQHSYGVISINSSTEIGLGQIDNGEQLEIFVQVESVDPGVTKFGLFVRQSPDHTEQTAIYFLNAIPPTEGNMPGSNYHEVVIHQDPEFCQALCYEDFMCRAWSYTLNGNSATCFLKNYPVDLSPNTEFISGRRPTLVIDRTNSTTATDADKSTKTAPLYSAPDTLRIFLDHSVVEVFANDGTSNLLTRIYPTLSQSTGVSLFVEGEGNVELNVDAWEMGTIWTN